MHNAGLDHRLREHGVDGIGEALQSVDDGNEDVGHTPVLELAHDAHPELRPLGQDTERDVHRLVADKALIPEFDPDRVEEDQRVAGVKRPFLPFSDGFQHGVGDRRD